MGEKKDKVSEVYKKFSTPDKRRKIAEKHSKDSCKCEGIVPKRKAIKRAEKIIENNINQDSS